MTAKRMTGEQFLNSLRYLDSEITVLDNARVKLADRRQELLEQAENNGAAINGVSVQHGVTSKTECIGVQLADLMTPRAIVGKLNDYQRRINRRIDELVDRKRKAQELIDRMPEAIHRIIILSRYVNNLKWSTIADLTGYTDEYIRRELKEAALAAFELVWGKTLQKPTDI